MKRGHAKLIVSRLEQLEDTPNVQRQTKKPAPKPSTSNFRAHLIPPAEKCIMTNDDANEPTKSEGSESVQTKTADRTQPEGEKRRPAAARLRRDYLEEHPEMEQQEFDEYRVDPEDGVAYTKQEFIDEYGAEEGSTRWRKAANAQRSQIPKLESGEEKFTKAGGTMQSRLKKHEKNFATSFVH